MTVACSRAAALRGYPRSLLACVLVMVASTSVGRACDGRSYSVDASVGQIASGGGLEVQIDKLKLRDDVPDSYTISVKDDGQLLADHVILPQFDTVSYKTRCGTVTIGADRKSMFHHSTLTVNWSYF